jgi:hypothetical protein
MTKEQVRSEMKKRLPEYFDDYLLVGVVAGSTEVVISFPDREAVIDNISIQYAVQEVIKNHGPTRR